MDLRNKALVDLIFEFIDRILFIEKKTTFEFKGVKLYPSEIHLILFIHRGEDTNATRMAEQLGVTKGAISQTLTRLEKKGILRKIKDPYKKNELTVEFPTFGREVLDHYLKKAGILMQQYDEYFSALSNAEREVIKRFLTHAGRVMSEQMENND
jgi:DNA-binding MarR family transcriptional regulator